MKAVDIINLVESTNSLTKSDLINKLASSSSFDFSSSRSLLTDGELILKIDAVTDRDKTLFIQMVSDKLTSKFSLIQLGNKGLPEAFFAPSNNSMFYLHIDTMFMAYGTIKCFFTMSRSHYSSIPSDVLTSKEVVDKYIDDNFEVDNPEYSIWSQVIPEVKSIVLDTLKEFMSLKIAYEQTHDFSSRNWFIRYTLPASLSKTPNKKLFKKLESMILNSWENNKKSSDYPPIKISYVELSSATAYLIITEKKAVGPVMMSSDKPKLNFYRKLLDPVNKYLKVKNSF